MITTALSAVIGAARAKVWHAIIDPKQVIRWDDLVQLVVEAMDREAGPRIILASEQAYHLLSPLYAGDRELLTFSADSSLFRFSYGTREIVVSKMWEWRGAEDVIRVLEDLPARFPDLAANSEVEVLVLAGGWGSGFLPDVAALEERGLVLHQSWATGLNPDAQPTARMIACVLDWVALRADAPPAE